MTHVRRCATLFATLLFLSLAISPGATADGEADPLDVYAHVPELALGGGCEESHGPWLESGRVAFKSRGYFPAAGRWFDGCGGKGCDDGAYGFIWNSAGRAFYWQIDEVRIRGECRVSCSIESSSGTLYRFDVRGRLHIDAHDAAVWFSCGSKDDGTWLYDGMIYHYWNWDGDAPEDNVPAIESELVV